MPSAVVLTQELVRFKTINPPGAERACAQRLARMLEAAGFKVDMIPVGDGRAQLIARIGGWAGKLPLAFTGHIDTVPLGAQPWSVDPPPPATATGTLYGRPPPPPKSPTASPRVAAPPTGRAASQRLSRPALPWPISSRSRPALSWSLPRVRRPAALVPKRRGASGRPSGHPGRFGWRG